MHPKHLIARCFPTLVVAFHLAGAANGDVSFQSSRTAYYPYSGVIEGHDADWRYTTLTNDSDALWNFLPNEAGWLGDVKVVSHPINDSGANFQLFPDSATRRVRKAASTVPGIELLDYSLSSASTTVAEFYSDITRDSAKAERASSTNQAREFIRDESGYYYHEPHSSIRPSAGWRLNEDGGLTFVEVEEVDIPTAVSLRHASPYFARIVNQSGVLVAEARAFSKLESRMVDDSLSATGAVWADTLIHPAAIQNSNHEVTASANSEVSAQYSVTEGMDFILDLSLAGSDHVEVQFSMSDVARGAEVFANSVRDGDHMSWAFCGTLSPGQYAFEIQTITTASTASALPSVPGGSGYFDLYFRAFTPHSRQEEYAVSVPEPDNRSLSVLGLFLPFFRQRKARPIVRN